MTASSGGREKEAVRDFWDAAACGEVYAEGDTIEERLRAHAHARYALEPYLWDFARFDEGVRNDVLEIGVGMGADHLEWARYRPQSLTGVDLTARALGWTRRRLAIEGFTSDLLVADAEHLPFADGAFDLVFSWGVLHHTPDTAAAFAEVHRVLRPEGIARVMIYHYHSIVGYLLWARYGLLRMRPRRSLAEIYSEHLESPGTQAFTVEQARDLTRAFSHVEIRTLLTFGDLLEGEAGQRHRGPVLALAKRVWPRSLIRRALPGSGLALLIEATK